jgi:hypothetical protein
MKEINHEASLNKLLSELYGCYRGFRYEIHPHGFIFKTSYYSTERALFEGIDRWIENGGAAIGNSLRK